MGKKVKSSKRKARESDLAAENAIIPEVLPLQNHVDKDEDGVMDDLNEPTMGEKLAVLNLAEKEKAITLVNVDSASHAKAPSADSVHILLKQALHADDRALLIDCLFRQDEKVITNSLSSLNPADVVKLLQSLVSLIQLRGAVLACALPWLRSLLLHHASSIMSQESSIAALNSQLIESRVSTFNQALQLSGCLDLLYAETIDDGEDENDVVTPFVYDDNSESDNEGSEEYMDIESVEDGEEPRVYSDISDDGEISD